MNLVQSIRRRTAELFKLLPILGLTGISPMAGAQANPDRWDMRGNWYILFFAEDGTYGLNLNIVTENIWTGQFSGTAGLYGDSGTVSGQITDDSVYFKSTPYYPTEFWDSIASDGTLSGSCLFETPGTSWSGWDYSVAGNATQAVPEPAPLLVLGIGGVLLRGRSNKRDRL